MILRTAAAKLYGISRFTLMRWECEDVHVHACRFRRGWYVVEKLAALGLCPMPQADGSPLVPQAEARSA